MRDQHFLRLLRVAEIIKRAAERRSTSESLRLWLDMPRPGDGRSPAALLEAGEYDRARYCAVSTWMLFDEQEG